MRFPEMNPISCFLETLIGSSIYLRKMDGCVLPRGSLQCWGQPSISQSGGRPDPTKANSLTLPGRYWTNVDAGLTSACLTIWEVVPSTSDEPLLNQGRPILISRGLLIRDQHYKDERIRTGLRGDVRPKFSHDHGGRM